MTKQNQSSEYQWQVFATLLKETAEKKQISNYQIQQETGYSRSTIGRIFNLEFCPNFQIILDIAKILDFEIKLKHKK